MCGLKEGGAGQEPGRAEMGEEEARWSLHPEPNREQVSGSPCGLLNTQTLQQKKKDVMVYFMHQFGKVLVPST